MQAPTYFRAEGLAPLVAITDDGRLLATLDEVMLGWKMAPVSGTELAELQRPGRAAIVVRHGEKGWTCSGETYAKPLTFSDPVGAACSLIAALFMAHTFNSSEGMVLHAAGVRVGDGLILLTGHYRAGKTVVTTACAAAGLQVYSDDIIPFGPDGRTARAPGLAIRLRLPLPDGLAQETREFVETYRVVSNQRYVYICPPPDRLARNGARAPIRAVVSLRRAEGASTQLSRLGPGDALKEAILRNFAREIPAGRILDTFDRLVSQVPCLSLDYDRAEDAVSLLRDAFTGALPEIEDAGPTAADANRTRKAAAALDDDAMIFRQPGAQVRERGGQAFLTDVDNLVIFNLNATATAVWRLLEQPVEFGDLKAVFAAGFPDREPEALTADLAVLIRDLAASALIRIEVG